MNTGIILGLGLITIVISFYIILNIPYWLLLLNKRKSKSLDEEKKYHQWAYNSDDAMNKLLKFSIYCLYVYGAYVLITAMWSKYS